MLQFEGSMPNGCNFLNRYVKQLSMYTVHLTIVHSANMIGKIFIKKFDRGDFIHIMK